MCCLRRDGRFNIVFKNFICFCLLLLLLSGCVKSVQKVSYMNDEAKAETSLMENMDNMSILKMSPKDLTEYGFMYLANNNLKIAELHFTEALNKDPEMFDAYIGLGKIEIYKGNYKSALARFNKANELKPESIEALIGGARALRFDGQLNAAIKKINQEMMIESDNIDILRELAMIYDVMGKENLSAALYKEILEKTPDDASSYNNLGLNQIVREKYDEAISSFLKALEIDKTNNRIKNNLATAYALSGEERKALNIFKSTVGEAAAYNNLGYIYMTRGRFNEAGKAFKKAIQINPQFYPRAEQNLEELRAMQNAAKFADQK